MKVWLSKDEVDQAARKYVAGKVKAKAEGVTDEKADEGFDGVPVDRQEDGSFIIDLD